MQLNTSLINEALLNLYSHDEDERLPWHTDRNPLYSDYMDVMAMNLGSPGIYCFAPQQKNQLYGLSLMLKGTMTLGKKELLTMDSEECCQFFLVT